MRSFARKVKEEIIICERNDRQYKAELSALIQFLSSIAISNRGLTIEVKTENPDISRFVMRLVKIYYHVDTETSIIRKMRLNKNKVYLITIMNKAREILEDLELWTKEGLQDHPSRNLISNRENAMAYLAGCFLAAGSVNDPKKTDYHLEISATKEKQAQYIIKALKKIGLIGKTIKRRNQFVVYIKSVDAINDFLAYVGATYSALEYADIRIQRDALNSYTRLENCVTANIVKTIEAGKNQVKAIERLKKIGSFDYLDDKLKETAELRLENPEDSLIELSEKYYEKTGNQISKSGIKHRLEKLVSIADVKKV